MKTKNSTHAGTAARRKEIIQAALACFTELGFTHTGMADIRRRSKASTGSIYHHFKSKQQLAAEVYIEGIRDYQEGFVSALEEQEHARDGIFAVVNYHLKWVEKNPEWAVYLFQKRYAEFMGSTEGEVERHRRQPRKPVPWRVCEARGSTHDEVARRQGPAGLSSIQASGGRPSRFMAPLPARGGQPRAGRPGRYTAAPPHAASRRTPHTLR